MSGHACLWCGAHNCPDWFEHDRLWAGTEQYARLSLAERLACPGCGRPVYNGQSCAAAQEAAGALPPVDHTALIRRAIADPGQFCERATWRVNGTALGSENIASWGARAVVIALAGAA